MGILLSILTKAAFDLSRQTGGGRAGGSPRPEDTVCRKTDFSEPVTAEGRSAGRSEDGIFRPLRRKISRCADRNNEKTQTLFPAALFHCSAGIHYSTSRRDCQTVSHCELFPAGL